MKISNLAAYRAIYSAYVQSKIDYCCAVWGAAAYSVLSPLIAIHKKFMKMMLRIPWNDHLYSYDQVVKLAKAQTIHQRYVLSASALIYTHLHHNILSNDYDLVTLHPNYSTRYQPRFQVPFTKFTSIKKSIRIILPKLLNSNPDIDPYSLTKYEFLQKIFNYLP